MELRGHDDDSEGDDFLPNHRRLDHLGHLYSEAELCGAAVNPSSLTTAVPPAPLPVASSLSYNNSGVLASGSAFRRPILFPSPLSSTAPPAAAPAQASSHRQSLLSSSAGEELAGRGGSSEDADASSPTPAAVRLPSTLDPTLSLIGERAETQQRQRQHQHHSEGLRKDHPDAGASKPFGDAGGGLSTARPRARGSAIASPIPRASGGGGGATVRYRECLKNHAARIGGHVLDGCGEFMPGGEEGTAEALKCAACSCHRSFHRKEVEGGEEAEALFLPLSAASLPPGASSRGVSPGYYIPGGAAGNGARGGGGARNLHSPQPLSLQSPFADRRPQKQRPRPAFLPPSTAGGHDDEENNYSGGTTTTESSSEEMQAHMLAAAHPHPLHQFQASHFQHHAGAGGAGSASGSAKKRQRTKFTAAQKEMMAEFAERVGWRMQKQDDGALERFCREAGVSRQVFKVWMHNNKQHVLKSKQDADQPPPQPLPPPQPPSSSSS